MKAATSLWKRLSTCEVPFAGEALLDAGKTCGRRGKGQREKAQASFLSVAMPAATK